MEKLTVSEGFVINLYTPTELKAHLDEYIIGQDQAKRSLCTAIYNHYKRLIISRSGIQNKVEKSNMLIAGPSGCGKTAMVKCIADYMGVPYYIGDATSITQAGYVGDDVETLITGLLRACDYNIEKAQCGIVFLDEIDKLAKRGANPNISRDVVGEGVQQALLKIVEGNIVGVPPMGGRKHPEAQLLYVDTTNILFVGSGAFSGIEPIIKERVAPERGIGFNSAEAEEINDDDIYSYMCQEDLREFGMIPEFIGRFPKVVTISQLKTDELVKIITEPKDSIANQYATLLAMDDIELSIEKSAVRFIADLAIKLKTGARALRSIFEDVMNDYMFDLPGSGVTELTITESIVREKLSKRYAKLIGKEIEEEVA